MWNKFADPAEGMEEEYEKYEKQNGSIVAYRRDICGGGGWLKIDETEGEIEDISHLTDIKNKEGDEEFREEEGGRVVWENKGEDIRKK